MKASFVKPKLYILGSKVDCVQISDVVEIVENWIIGKSRHNYIVTSNANNVVLAVKNKEIKEAVNNSSLSVADGISLVITARFYGYPLKSRVYGPDLMLALLALSEKKRYTNFFLGSTQENLFLLEGRLKKSFPLLKIAGRYSPSFGEVPEEEKTRVKELINGSNVDILWVGLGGPKQDIWMFEYKERINVPVMIGVGAAFDFLAGTKLQAPRWMRKSGLEWFFRLITEPNRLWRRYLVNNILFVWYVVVELFSNAFTCNKIDKY